MGDYFKIYDEKFNRIPLPKDELGYGLNGLDLFVSSIGQDITEHKTSGRPGNIITGIRDDDRDIRIHAMIEAMNPTDYRLKRDRVFAFFKSLGSFYVTETQQGNKLMKVRVVDKFTADRPLGHQRLADVEIPLKIDGQPYWISRFKTMDLHNNKGVPTNGNWSFGMGIDVSPDNLVYQHENKSEFTIFNAGRQIKTVLEKGHCEIIIEIRQVIASFTLYDDTGRYWEYNPSRNEDWSLRNGDVIIFNGHDVRLNGTTIMERTNRYYPVINSGINKFKIDGLLYYRATFDFRFKYD